MRPANVSDVTFLFLLSIYQLNSTNIASSFVFRHISNLTFQLMPSPSTADTCRSHLLVAPSTGCDVTDTPITPCHVTSVTSSLKVKGRGGRLLTQH